MTTKPSELHLPLPANVSADEARTVMAVKLFELGRVSLGQAAGLAGYSLRAFIDVLGRHGVPVVNHAPEDLAAELED